MSEYPVHIEIAPRVHMIRGSNRARFPEANSIFIDDEILTLVDAGSNLGHIKKTLKDFGHKTSDLERIVLTHFHIDHKGHAGDLQKESDCEILCHSLAERGVRSFEGLVELIGIDGHQYRDDWLEYIEQAVPHIKTNYEITDFFHDCSPISCGETTLFPIHSPGHSADHTCFGLNG
ncbi:MAG: MBL fold metallo-hydrolase, partial [Candidatus Thorarchaeota archaeon]